MIDIVLNNYDVFLRRKLESIRPIVNDLIVDDSENQLSAFLISTIKQINEEGMEDTKMDGKYNLTLKNIESLAGKYFPPCMLNLNQHLKISRHLKHDGRRQLWGFFKACGMDVHDNKEYFRKHLEGKVTASEMKTHMYNIEHAYGLQGKRKA
jgi:DNA primase large subunit